MFSYHSDRDQSNIKDGDLVNNKNTWPGELDWRSGAGEDKGTFPHLEKDD